MKQNNNLPGSIVKIVSGYIESGLIENVVDTTASTLIGDLFQCQGDKQNCILALKENIINKKKNPVNVVQRRYDLHISVSTFKRLKYSLCYEIAFELKLIS